MGDFLAYISENAELIKNNLLTFIIGWILCFILGWVASWFVFNLSNERYKNKYTELHKKYKSLKSIQDRDDLASAVSGTGKKNSPLAGEISNRL